MSPGDDDTAQIVQTYGGMYRGMLERDTVRLDAPLGQDYTLTQMTGYRQTKAQWLAQITTGET